MTPIRIGVAGLAFGEQLVRTLVNMGDYSLVAVADHDRTRAERVAAAHSAKAYGEATEMIEREELDALCVAVSPRSRKPILETAAQRKLALFVEKPWASDLAQAVELYDLCRKARSVVMVAFSFRFHPVVQRLVELRASELGEPWLCNGSYVFAWLPPKEHWLWARENGNGFFNDNSGHLLDVVCALLGRPVEVSAFGGNFTHRPSEDGAAVAIRFAAGASAALSLGGVGASASSDFPRLDVMFERGQARLSGRNHIWEELSWAGRGETALRTMVSPPEALGATRYTNAFAHFADCVRNHREPSSTMADGIRAVALAEAVYRSIVERRTVEIADLSAFEVANT